MIANKNFKLFFLLGLIIYSLSFIATKKNMDLDPCTMAINSWFDKDTSLNRYAYITSAYQDTVVIRADTTNPNTMNWNIITDSVCSIIKSSCGLNNKPILVINNRDTTTSLWDTRFGKKIYFKQCP